jgi:hypothetical protein
MFDLLLPILFAEMELLKMENNVMVELVALVLALLFLLALRAEVPLEFATLRKVALDLALTVLPTLSNHPLLLVKKTLEFAILV